MVNNVCAASCAYGEMANAINNVETGTSPMKQHWTGWRNSANACGRATLAEIGKQQQGPGHNGDQHDRLAYCSGNVPKASGGTPTVAEAGNSQNHAEERRRYWEAIRTLGHNSKWVVFAAIVSSAAAIAAI